VDGAFSEWAVRARDDREMVATGTVGFVVVDFGRFVRRRLAPKAAEMAADRPNTKEYTADGPAEESAGEELERFVHAPGARASLGLTRVAGSAFITEGDL
jgi:hypothetical protein